MKLLDCKHIPSSSTSTTSAPQAADGGQPSSSLVATVWCGASHERIDLSDPLRIQKVWSSQANTPSPRFDTELSFPVQVAAVEDVLAGTVAVSLADEATPEEEGDVGGEVSRVGMVKIPFKDIFKAGKLLTSSVLVPPAYYALSSKKSPP
ncbi:hypothetical protein TeGR_g3386, partial [Tetraparma gracilis]